MDVAKGHNLSNKKNLSPKSVKNYLFAAASHAISNGAPDPRLQFNPSGISTDSKTFFPNLTKLLSHLKKWSKGRNEALPLTLPILHILNIQAMQADPFSRQRCIFDAICLGLHTGSRCGEYCRGHPTNPEDIYSRVPSSHFSGPFADMPLAFSVSDFSFLDTSMLFLPWNAANDASHVRVRFRFDKGGGTNFSMRTFRRLAGSASPFCPVRAALRAISRWSTISGDSTAPIFCFGRSKSVHFLDDTAVTAHLRQATILAYPQANHLYRSRIADIRTHSIRVTACLILVAADLPDAVIEHRLRWASTAWKMYVRECLSHIDKATASSFYSALTDEITNTPTSQQHAFPASDGDDLL